MSQRRSFWDSLDWEDIQRFKAAKDWRQPEPPWFDVLIDQWLPPFAPATKTQPACRRALAQVVSHAWLLTRQGGGHLTLESAAGNVCNQYREFANAYGTVLGYLRQLAGAHNDRQADIAAATALIDRQRMAAAGGRR